MPVPPACGRPKSQEDDQPSAVKIDGAAREWPTNLRNPDAEGFARPAALGELRLASKRSLVANPPRCEAAGPSRKYVTAVAATTAVRNAKRRTPIRKRGERGSGASPRAFRRLLATAWAPRLVEPGCKDL